MKAIGIRDARDWGFSLETEIIGLIVEVKTGNLGDRPKLVDALKSFQRERVKAALRRMGMFENQQIEDYWVKNLWKHSTFPILEEKASHRIGKLFITAEAVSRVRLDRLEQEEVDNHVLTLTLSDIDDFISQRIQRYKDRKNRDRVLFPDDLLQYLFWKQR